MITNKAKMDKIPSRLLKVLKLACSSPINRLLDIGCGTGGYSILLKNNFGAREVYGIELSSVAVRNIKKKGKSIKVTRTDLNKDSLHYPEGYFDLVFAGEIIEHLILPDKLLDDIFRVLSPGGNLIITVPNIANWYCRLQLLMGYQPYSIPVSMKYRWVGAFCAKRREGGVTKRKYTMVNAQEGLDHVRFFTTKGICDLLKAHGFKIIEIKGTTTDEFAVKLPAIIRVLIKGFDNIMASIPGLASGVIINAKKHNN